jgi:Domain of unknown function (DUF4082)
MHHRIVVSLLCFLGMLLSGETGGLAQTYTIFGNAVPRTPVDPDTSAVTLGVKFTSTQAGEITGIRFYRGHTNSSYVVALYGKNGTRLATASVKGDTCAVPCWEHVNFIAPVSINANTQYVAAYYTSGGRYADDQGGLLSNVSNPPLSALANGGVYHYGWGIGFPTQIWNSSDYWVDVLFTPTTLPQQVISSIALSNKTVTANQPAGSVVGQASAVMSPTTPAFSGSFATPATDPYFQMSGTALVTAQPLGAGTYSTSIIATQSGIADSPFTQGETITVTSAPTLSVSLSPPSPTIASNAPLGTVVATVIASWSDGSPFTGTLTFGMPYSNDNATFAVSGNNLIVNPAGPGVSAYGGTIQNVTIVATQ